MIATLVASLLVASLVAQTDAPAATPKKSKKAPAAQPAPQPPLPPVIPARADSPEKEVRQIPIDEKRASKIYRIRTAIGYPATIEFPDAFAGAPACGDCGDKGLFRLDVFDEQHYVTVKPRLFPGPQADGSFVSPDEFVTTINVRLASQITLTLQVELADRDRADARVVFTLPQRDGETAFVRSEIAKAKRKLEDDYASRLQAGVTNAFLRALNDPHYCSAASARARVDDAVVEVRELCYFGSGVYVRFSLENRGRAPFDLADVVLKRRGSGSQAEPAPDASYFVPQPHLEFQAAMSGVIGFHLGDGEEPARSYELSVYEKGGKNRVITASGFGF